MQRKWIGGLAALALVVGQAAFAEDAAAPAVAPAAPAADAPAVQVSATGAQVVTVNTGNETVDAAANLAARCVEKAAAMQACGGGLKGIGCKKALELTKYKGLDCPGQ